MTEQELYWLAGLLEGEGTFLHGSPSNRNSPGVVLHMTDRDVVDKAARLMGCYKVSSMKPQKDHHKPTWRVAVRGLPAIVLMKTLLPLMGERRSKRIEEIIENFDYDKQGRRWVEQRKLTDDQVKEARLRYQQGMNAKELAVEYGVCFTGFYRMLKGSSYKHIAQ